MGATGREPLLERTLPTTHVSSFKTQSSCAVAALRSQPQTEQGRTCTEARGQKQVLNRKTAFTPTHPFPLWGLFCVGPCGDCPGECRPWSKERPLGLALTWGPQLDQTPLSMTLQAALWRRGRGQRLSRSRVPTVRAPSFLPPDPRGRTPEVWSMPSVHRAFETEKK